MAGEGQGTGPIRGRGVAWNPPNRFERTWHELDPEADDPDLAEPAPRPVTQFLPDASRTIIATNDSPDVPFDASINPYRGCEHGCSYCFARPSHEYLGLSAGLDFETKVHVKHDAAVLLRKALVSPRWKPQALSMSGVTDAYQPVERKLRITRGCLEVLAEFRNPVAIVTKNALVLRDVDLLSTLATYQATAVYVSITTLSGSLARKLEPRTSPPGRRLAAVEGLASAGIPVGVMVAPLIPGLNDHEMPAILEVAAAAGASRAGYIPLRLPGAVAPLFEQWLDDHVPGQKDKVLNRVRAIRNGNLNDPRFGNRMRGAGTFADVFRNVFHATCTRLGLNQERLPLSTASFRRPPEGGQLLLFD